ncbi:MAG: hypothetical protein GY755_09685 [Chloroflexi bacterium]|nr:hypothetical protein [Chloroflexota bacterium]
MNTVELIRLLSDQGAKDFSELLSWINPIPKNAEEVPLKIDIAKKQLSYKQNRQGSSEQDNTLNERARLSRLNEEVQSILSNSKSCA